MQEVKNYPFGNPDFKVGESEDKNIWAYTQAGMVVKQDKRLLNGLETTASLANLGYVLHRAQLDRLTIQKLRETIKDLGHNTQPLDVASRTEYVVHQTPAGECFYTETEPLVREYVHLGDLGLGVFGLPKETLQDLCGIFKASYVTAQENDYTLCLAGSFGRPTNVFRKVLRNLLPLLSSTNIVIDAESRPHFIDVGRFEDINPHGNTFGLRRKIQTFGALSGWLLTRTALLFK
jgi:hypothetical protein